jgi:hypothetical protein
MLDLCRIIFWIVVDLVRPRAALQAEILVLRKSCGTCGGATADGSLRVPPAWRYCLRPSPIDLVSPQPKLTCRASTGELLKPKTTSEIAFA